MTRPAPGVVMALRSVPELEVSGRDTAAVGVAGLAPVIVHPAPPGMPLELNVRRAITALACYEPCGR